MLSRPRKVRIKLLVREEKMATYLDGREKRKRRRSVDRIEGQ